jgi:mono/diheme cytochrome c family protein
LLALLVMATMGLVTAVACLADIPDNAVTMDQVMRGRQLVLTRGCGDCHNGAASNNDPRTPTWLDGDEPGTTIPFLIGPWVTYPKNLTPDKETGIGRYTDRQIFNVFRYGLDPDKTPDAAITGLTPGQGNFPATPYYIGPPMPWPSWRYMADGELWDIVAYLKHGVKPVNNKVPDSDDPPDHWASAYTPDLIGVYPAPAFPAAGEQFQP